MWFSTMAAKKARRLSVTRARASVGIRARSMKKVEQTDLVTSRG